MAQFRTKHYGVALCLIFSLFVGSSSAACCTDGETKVDPDDCTKYLACCHGEFVSKSCASGSYWNSDLEVCAVDEGQCNPPGCVEGEIAPNPDNCAGYLECVNGNVVIQTCPDGDYFNSTLNKCVEDTCGCNGSGSSCTDGDLKVDPTDCAGYLACSNGNWVSKQCADGAYFNATLETCVEDVDGVCVKCTDGDLKVDSTNCAGYLACSNGNWVSKQCADGAYFNATLETCVEDVDGVYVDGVCVKCTDGDLKVDSTNCAGYLACSNGNWVSKQCADGAYFNATLETCVEDVDGVCVNCTDGDLKGDSTNCAGYLACSNGNWVSKQCADGAYFNATLETCVEDVDGVCVKCTDGDLKVDSTNCAGYLACSNGNWVSKQCADGAYFNATLETCVEDVDGVCVKCTDGDLKVDSTNCAGYLACSNGNWVSKQCADGAYFNATLETCVEDVDGVCVNCTDGDLKVDSTNCAGYLACSNGNWVSKQCADGAYFNATLGTCVEDVDGVCVKCTEGSTKPLDDCTKYEICSGGQYVTKSCNSGYYWNNKTEACEVDNGQCNGSGSSCTENEVKVNPADCAGYLQCINGIFVARKCSATQFFNATLEQCEVDTENVCIPKTCDSDCCDVPNNSIWPVEKNCSAFYQCVNGIKYEQRCSNNLQYNSKIEQCDYPENVDCDDGSAPPSGPNAGPSGTYCESHGRCVGQRDGTMFGAASGTCSSEYVVCQCECEVNFTCSSGLLYNSVVKSCDWADNVKC
ncbi:chitin-binding domain protein cbd-1 [Drosophila teissieri]|uniref:chitin-binding domain protein cbd-1 n=1 Tax=Drosophila teissieri TaxID=7243 RepID=UPI001CBA16B3|nr:chitin-binding domain protein cbd-1 [Drosophila teissieri]